MATSVPVEDKQETSSVLTRIPEESKISQPENPTTNRSTELHNVQKNQQQTVRIFSIEDILRDVNKSQLPKIGNASLQNKECIFSSVSGGDSSGDSNRQPKPDSATPTVRKTEVPPQAVPVGMEPRTSMKSFYGHCLPTWAMSPVPNGNSPTGWLYPTLFHRQLIYDFNGKIKINYY